MLETQQANDGWTNYLVVEADNSGNGLRVVFFQADAFGDTRYEWPVPIERSASARAQVTSILRDGRELPAPTVTPRLLSTMGGDDDPERNA
jgi:hypothetical protein